MAAKRIEISKERLRDKINDGRKYLEKEDYDINELIRFRNNLEKKRAQFEKDITEYEKTDDKDENKLAEYEEFKIDAEDIFDDLEHYINVKKQQQQQREQEIEREREEEEKKREREEEEKKREREAEEKKREREEREKERHYQLEMEKIKIEERTKKLNVKLPKIELKRFNGDILKWTEFWDAFESTIHDNKSLHDVDKFNYLRSQLQGTA